MFSSPEEMNGLTPALKSLDGLPCRVIQPAAVAAIYELMVCRVPFFSLPLPSPSPSPSPPP